MMSAQAASGWSGGPAVAASGLVDQPSDDHQSSCEVEVELDDDLALVGTTTQLAVAVHPGMQTLDRPALPGLDRGGLPFGGDVSIEAQPVEQVAGLARVVAAVEVHVRELVVATQVAVLRQGADHVDDSGQCGLQQRRVVLVGP